MSSSISNMKIKNKLLLGFISCFLITVLIIVFIVIFNENLKLEKEIETYKKDEISKIKQQLQNYVTVAYETVQANYESVNNTKYLSKKYGRRIKTVIDIAFSIIKKNADLAKDNIISINEAKYQAKKQIKNIRFDDYSGYVWINDMTEPYPYMLMHPTNPKLDGKING